MKRREFLKGVLAGGTLGTLLGAGLLSSRELLAAWPESAFDSESLEGVTRYETTAMADDGNTLRGRYQRDGTREEFSRDKLISGLWVACAKRPIPASEVERIAGEIEAELQQLGRSEIKSRHIGDMAIKKLKEIDEVAYIRYAIVYLGLSDLSSIRSEIDELLRE